MAGSKEVQELERAARRIAKLDEAKELARRREQAEIERLKRAGWRPSSTGTRMVQGPGLADASRAIEAQLLEEAAYRAEAARRSQLAQATPAGPASSTPDPLAAWPDMRPTLPAMEIRSQDAYGEGRYGADRDGGARLHEGVDIAATPGTPVFAPFGGTFMIGDPYGNNPQKRGKVQSVRVLAPTGQIVRMFYVQPDAGLTHGGQVEAGSLLGVSQSLQDPALYPGITDHVHLQFEWPEHMTHDPTRKIEDWQRIIRRETGRSSGP